MTGVFTPEGTWFGGSYQLAIEVGDPDDGRLRAALEALWRHPPTR